MITLLHSDCMDYMRKISDKAFDLAIVDPPYFDGPQKLGFYGNGTSSEGVERGAYEKIGTWEPPGPEYFAELFRVSKNQIVWGANHFIASFPINSPGWIVWDKCNQGSDFADCELAWTSFDRGARLFPFMWNGMLQGSPQNGRVMQGNKALNEKRIHPTQKPVALYRWLLKNYASPGDRILDTHLGSGSSAIAAEVEGFDFVGMDKEHAYWEAAQERLSVFRAMPLFDNQPEQARMFQ